MDIQKDYSCLERNKCVLKKTLDAENDFQETLPAYCDDIYKVIKCVAKNSIVSADINYNEVIINCRCRIYLTYLNENNNLCFADFEEDFSRSVNVEGLTDSAFTCAFINNKYTNFRVINQRRIDVHSAAAITLEVYDTVKYPCLRSCENAKLKTQTLHTSDIVNSVLSKIEFDEEFSVPADGGQIKRIVSFCAYAYITDTKIIKDKALIKAAVTLEVLYTADTAQEELMKTVHSFTCSKILEVSGIDENDIAVTDADVNNVYLKAKLSSGDKMSVISAFGEVGVNSVFIRENDNDVISDGYVLNHQSLCRYSRYGYAADGSLLKESKTAVLSFNLPDEIREIKETDVDVAAPVFKGNKPVCSIQLNVIGTDENGTFMPYSAAGELELNTDNFANAVASVGLESYDFSFLQDGRLEVRLNVQITVYAFNDRTVQVLSDIDAGDEELDFPSLTLYFAGKSESLWDIAKQFSSDVDMIAAENDISGDTLDSAKALIIPRV